MKTEPFKKHITIACPDSGSGSSVATVAVKQARELTKYFGMVSLISESFSEELYQTVRQVKVEPRKYDYLRRFCHVPNEYSFVRSVRKSLEKLHAEYTISLLICQGHGLAALAAAPLKKKYGIPYALVTHGDIFERPKRTYDLRLTAFYKCVTPLAYRNADLVIALSPYMAEWATKGGANPNTVKIIPNGIDPEDIGINLKENSTFSTLNNSNRPLRLLYVGSLTVPKGVDILISACALMKKREIAFSLNIIGGGNHETS